MIGQFGVVYTLFLQPLTGIHLHSALLDEIEPTSDIATVYIFGSVALFILLIACINFMNLATARSAERAKEVGVRKVLGAYRTQLIGQFLAESVLLTGLALLLALLLASAALPLFNTMTGRALSLADNAGMLAVFGLVALLVGLLAGSYPAFFLSAFRPVQVLSGRFRTTASGTWLRSGLVVAQFAISMGLIVGTLVVTRQLNYAQTQRLGFDKEHLLVLPVGRDGTLQRQVQAFKADVARLPTVVRVSASDHYPGGPTSDISFLPEGRQDDDALNFSQYEADVDFVRTLGMELVAGRDLDPARPADSSAFLINETAARTLGWANPVGQRILEFTGPNPEDRIPHQVVGVVRDFHFESFRHTILPLVISINPRPENLLVRIHPGTLPQTIASLRETWERHAAGTPFQYTFLDEDFGQLYQSEEQLATLLSAFSFIAVFIACLGLFGLAAFTAQQRTKEIGVRKVLGASVGSVLVLLSKDFVRLVLVAVALVTPLAWWGMSRWLETFAYHVGIGPGVFLAAGGLAVAIALLTVSGQALRAATADPVRALRSE